MSLWFQRQTEITLANANVVRLTVVCAIVHPILYTPQVTLCACQPTQLHAALQLHDCTLKVAFQIIDACVAAAATAHCPEPRQVLVQPLAYVINPQIRNLFEMLHQPCDPFVFSDVLTGCVALPGRPEYYQRAFTRHRSIIATATTDKKLVGCIWHIDRHVCVQILRRRMQC